MKKGLQIILVSLLALACSRQSAKVEGRIEGAEGAQLILEKVAVGKITRIDSSTLSASGKFSFKIKNAEPATFYQLRLDTLSNLLLLAQNGDRIQLSAQARNLIASSSVTGSEDAMLLIQLQQYSAKANTTLDSLLDFPAQSSEAQKDVRRGASQLFVNQKKYNTKFIVTHITSPASIFAYYQKFGKQIPLFGGTEDRFLLHALADSMRIRFPKSTYTKSLLADLDVLESNARREAMQQMLAGASVMDKPEIELADAQGKMHSLAALKGKVVLLDFWASTNPISLMDNRELILIYKEYHKNGFEVFQVSLDEKIQEWESSVMQQGLPWVSVHCNAAQGCIAAQSYVVEKIPTNFLINRKGEIVGKNLHGEELKRRIKALL